MICITDNRTSAHPFLGYIIKSVAVEHHGLISHIISLVDSPEDKYAIMQTFLIPKARNIQTGQTIMVRDLAGRHYTAAQRKQVQALADLYAQKMSRTGDEWQGYVDTYTPGIVRA